MRPRCSPQLSEPRTAQNQYMVPTTRQQTRQTASRSPHPAISASVHEETRPLTTADAEAQWGKRSMRYLRKETAHSPASIHNSRQPPSRTRSAAIHPRHTAPSPIPACRDAPPRPNRRSKPPMTRSLPTIGRTLRDRTSAERNWRTPASGTTTRRPSPTKASKSLFSYGFPMRGSVSSSQGRRRARPRPSSRRPSR